MTITPTSSLTENELSQIIIREAIEVHKALGPGLLESVYVRCLLHRLTQLGLKVSYQFPIPVIYQEVKLDCGYRADLILEDKVIIEIKSVEALSDIHRSQLLTYLKLTKLKLGLLINFNVVYLKNGLKRVVNNL